MKTLIKNVKIVNEGLIIEQDLLIENDLISKIDKNIQTENIDLLIDGNGKYLLPGVIDDQVHFREPGLTYKADISTESMAAIAGGVTSFIEQPNTIPNTVTSELLEEKNAMAKGRSFANYAFSIGGTNDNLEELLKINSREVPAVKLFLGSSTGNMLVNDAETLEAIFSKIKIPICVHCEDEETIKKNTDKYREIYGEEIPAKVHHLIRSEEACCISSSKAIALAKKTGARLHIYHISTGKETAFFSNGIPLTQKKITSEVCVHHLWFTKEDYETKGMLIKWNPAVKTQKDKEELWKALLDDRLDVVATDHAPHTLEEKQNPYKTCPSGAPLVQHSLQVMLEAYKQEKISLEKIVEKMCHNPAIIFQIQKRGFLREGYKADLVLCDLDVQNKVSKENILYKCQWSPLDGEVFHSKITHTFVNGYLVYENGKISKVPKGERLLFDRKF